MTGPSSIKTKTSDEINNLVKSPIIGLFIYQQKYPVYVKMSKIIMTNIVSKASKLFQLSLRSKHSNSVSISKSIIIIM